MNTNELFENIQEDFITDESDGELTLQRNSIVWSYTLEDDCEDIDLSDCDDEDIYNQFESTTADEILDEVSNNYIEKLKLFLDNLNELENWTFSEPDIIEDTISFKLF